MICLELCSDVPVCGFGSGVRWFVTLCILSLCLVYVCGVCVLCCVV